VVTPGGDFRPRLAPWPRLTLPEAGLIFRVVGFYRHTPE